MAIYRRFCRIFVFALHIMTIAQRHITCFLAVWLLIVPFRTTVWQHLCLASGKAVLSLFAPLTDPCLSGKVAQSRSLSSCCTTHLPVIKEYSGGCCSSNSAMTLTGNLSASIGLPTVFGIASHKGCCETDAQTLGFDSDRLEKAGKNDQKHPLDLSAIELPCSYKVCSKPLFIAYAPLSSVLLLPFGKAPPPPYGRQKRHWIQIYRC